MFKSVARIPNIYNYTKDVKYLQLMFHIFNGDKIHKNFDYGSKYDTLAFIDSYMQSDIKKRMDENDFYAHALDPDQVYKLIPQEHLPMKTCDYEIEKLRWMAEVYCYILWTNNIYSRDISLYIPAQSLYNKCDLSISPQTFGKQLYQTVLADKNLPQIEGCEPFILQDDIS